ncbi:hypothetical protein ACFVYA_42255 [Amycolatopsis sp. NPDC058278]|uniref:hypothetical protein n=1 Tax=Amycolatopsis sp. NPDC058278 TaxID=3346417 RepID=UPI0036DC6C26
MISRFLLDLDPGIQRVLDWRERARALRSPRRGRRPALAGAGYVAGAVIVPKLTENVLPWLW